MKNKLVPPIILLMSFDLLTINQELINHSENLYISYIDIAMCELIHTPICGIQQYYQLGLQGCIIVLNCLNDNSIE